jgi:hypothetical protein
MNGKIGNKARRFIFIAKARDPFENMICKEHRSPTLRPVNVKLSKVSLKLSKSEEKLPRNELLPPISPKVHWKKRIDFKGFERLTLKTPNFNERSKQTDNYNIRERDVELSFGVYEQHHSAERDNF